VAHVPSIAVAFAGGEKRLPGVELPSRPTKFAIPEAERLEAAVR
jgi:hypothetical protein